LQTTTLWLPGRLQLEVVVESDDLVDAGQRHSEFAGEGHRRLARDVPVLVLDGVEDHDEVALLVAPGGDMILHVALDGGFAVHLKIVVLSGGSVSRSDWL
jgi:hypothetical protein